MAKRFIDTSFYKSPFVRGLKGSLKSLYSFIICDCDGAGIWSADFEIAGTYIGFTITKKEFEIAFLQTGKAIDLKNGRYFFPDFIEHQYPKGLSIHNPAQKNFITDLQKYSLIDEDLKVLRRPFEGSKVMVKEKVMDMEEEKGNGKPPKKTDLDFIEDKKKEFIESLKPFLNTYTSETLNSFYRYWAEPSIKKKKLKWEMQDTWDIGLRLITWSKNEQKFNNGKSKQSAREEKANELSEFINRNISNIVNQGGS